MAMSATNNSILYRIYTCLIASIKPATKTIVWLLKIMLPVSFGVMLLDYFEILVYIAHFTEPFMQFFGLSGESALVLLSGGLLNIYSAVAVIETIDLSMREITILALMSLIAHNLIIETIVQKKTGSNGIWIVMLRIIAAILGGLLLNFMLPIESELRLAVTNSIIATAFNEVLLQWLISTLHLVIKVVVIIFLLNYLQRLLDEFKITLWLSKFMAPILKLFGLPPQASFMWLIANIIGLAWGSAVLIEEVKLGKISRSEANLLNQHIAISHSQLEDTLLFVAIGVSAPWIILPRLLFAFISVWLYRFIYPKAYNNSNQPNISLKGAFIQQNK